jgi:RimJ/RimL family protein N-acetyltransferase
VAKNPDVSLAPLTAGDAQELAALLRHARTDYVVHFHPFAFDEESVSAQLSAARADRFWAIRDGGALAGFFMLRGFDAGYARPSFGVFVAEKFAGRGLATQALAHALEWCREHGVEEAMLKVHPQNTAARSVYERLGFRRAGVCGTTGHDILVKQIVSE